MVIGNGLLANAFKSYEEDCNIIIFASGVSNSRETRISEFEREQTALMEAITHNPTRLLIYFSTCSIEDQSQSDSLYVKHKLSMESLVQTLCQKYYIFRLPQVVGISASPTIINFFVDSIINNKAINIHKNATRNLIYVDDVFKIANIIIKKECYLNEIVNIATPYNLKIFEILHILEVLLNKKANYKIVVCGEIQDINIKHLNELKIQFQENYVENILEKYIKEKGFR